MVKADVDLGLENGKKLRVDTTVVESDILSAAVDKMLSLLLCKIDQRVFAQFAILPGSLVLV